MIKAIIFDLGKVVVNFDQMICARKLEKYSNKKADFIFKIITDKKLVKLHETSKINSKEFYMIVKEKIDLNLTYNDFINIFNDIFTLNQGVYDLAKKLKEDYAVYALSNTNKSHFDYLNNKYKISKLFDYTILSYKVKARKLDKKIYEYAINKSRVKPSEIIYIDDIKEFADAASKLGINGLNYTTTEKLVEDLRKLDIEI